MKRPFSGDRRKNTIFILTNPRISGILIFRIEYYGNEEDEYSGVDPKRACGWWKQAVKPDEYHLRAFG